MELPCAVECVFPLFGDPHHVDDPVWIETTISDNAVGLPDHLSAVAIPFLPEIRVEEINISLLTAKLIVMFFAFELLLHTFAERLKPFEFVSLWVLLGLGFRAWW